MDILVSRTLYMSCQAGPGIEPGPSALKASALPIELTWQTKYKNLLQYKFIYLIIYKIEYVLFTTTTTTLGRTYI